MLGFMYRHMDEELKPFIDTDIWFCSTKVNEDSCEQVDVTIDDLLGSYPL